MDRTATTRAFRRYTPVIALFLLMLPFASCLKGGKLSAITVAPSDVTITKDTNQQLRATAFFTDGSLLDWTTASAWTSSDDAIASVGNTFPSQGLVKAHAAGTVTITARDAVNNLSATAVVTVPAAALTSISIIPSDAVISAATSTQFSAMGNYEDSTTHDLTSSVTWTSSDSTIATIASAPSPSAGLATAGSTTGGTEIRATDPATGIFSTATLTVQ